MTNLKHLIIFTALLTISTSTLLAQGSLTPTNAPSASMKTLSQLEPRIPISSAPYSITTPGSYYLTTNISSTNSGITINADNVTLDLMGFEISGIASSNLTGSGISIGSFSQIKNVTIKNGTINKFYNGIILYSTDNSNIENLNISDNNFGIYFYSYLSSCSRNKIINCTVTHNNNEGISFDGFSGTCIENTISESSINHNKVGIYITGSAYGDIGKNNIINCIISDNIKDGITISAHDGLANANKISECSIIRNGTGISINGAEDCNANCIIDCQICSNTNRGINLLASHSGLITGCNINNNFEGGVYMLSCKNNRIENNHFADNYGTANTFGLFAAYNESKNIIICNSSIGQTNNFAVNIANTYGPIVTNSGALGTNGAPMSPWANFSR